MRIYFAFAITLGGLTCTVPLLHAQSATLKVFYQKILPDKRKILVLRQEVPFIPPPPEGIYIERKGKTLLHLTPMDVKPDRTGEFSLFLVSKRGDFRRLLWKKKISEYIELIDEPEVRFLDAFLDKQTLVVVHNIGTIYEADVVTPHFSPKTALNPDLIFYQKKRSYEPYVAAVTVQRWGKDKRLSLAVHLTDGETGRFLWTPWAKAGESKWVRVKRPPAPKPIATLDAAGNIPPEPEPTLGPFEK